MAVNFISATTVPLELIGGDSQDAGRATGFFYESSDKKLFLVTNWHVVTGRSPVSPKHSKSGLIPHTIRTKLHAKQVDPNQINIKQLYVLDVPINTKDGDQPRWREHPKFRYNVDVVAIEIDGKMLEGKCHFHILNRDSSLENKYTPEVMDDVFVVGYPWGLSSSGAVLPIYKRGSIASEPKINYMGLPRLLVDCRTSPAMSGSPVLCRHDGVWNPDGKFTENTVIGTVTNFVGVYSGRLISQAQTPEETSNATEIGVVWKRSALDEIVSTGVPGATLTEIAALP